MKHRPGPSNNVNCCTNATWLTMRTNSRRTSEMYPIFLSFSHHKSWKKPRINSEKTQKIIDTIFISKKTVQIFPWISWIFMNGISHLFVIAWDSSISRVWSWSDPWVWEEQLTFFSWYYFVAKIIASDTSSLLQID